MRARGSLLVVSLVFLGGTAAFAQNAEDPPLQLDPYNKHHDRHMGHNHVYPDRGSVFRDAPKGSTTVNYAGLAYRFYNGVWFEPRGPAYIVVMPPIGVVVSALPAFATPLESGGHSYLYANEVYYLPRPDLGGYEVVNDPADDALPTKGAVASTGSAVPAVAATSAIAAVPAVVPSPSMKVTYDPKAPLGSPWNPMPDDPPGATSHSYAQTASVPSAASTAPPAPTATAAPSVAIPTPTPTPTTVAATSPAGGPLPAAANTITTTSNTGAILAAGTAPSASAAAAGPTPATPSPNFVGPTPAGSAGYVGGSPVPVATQPTSAAPSAPAPAGPSYSYAPPPASATPAVAVNAGPTTAAAAQGYYTTSTSTGASNGLRFTVYPRNNQSADQQARDQYDCYRFGVAQTGFDPMSGGVAAAPGKPGQTDFDRARAACFEGRGYTVR